jgi:hypothetical protein
MSTTHIPGSGSQSATNSGMIARPQWLDEQLYPFQSRFVEIDGNRIHYKAITISPGVRSHWRGDCDPHLVGRSDRA